MQALRDRCARAAGDGRYEPYKLSLQFDNPQARLPHDFPLDITQKEVQEMLFAGRWAGARSETSDDGLHASGLITSRSPGECR